MATRAFTVEATDKGRIRVEARIHIAVEPGYLTKGELDQMKKEIADQIMYVLPNVRHLHVHLSDIKVKR